MSLFGGGPGGMAVDSDIMENAVDGSGTLAATKVEA